MGGNINGVLIGKQIKALRNEKGVTQEELASFLGISYQAVSKWENGATAPDIQLLPELSVYFGVTIDELFKLTNEDKLKRIDSLIENERYISEEKFLETEKFLLDLLKEDRKSSKALYLLAELYNHKGDRAKETAAEYAIKDFKTALDKQEKPRYPEMAEALAQAYEIKKEYDKSIEANKEKLKILKEDYGILNGELVDEALREIKRLKAEIRS
ncbi:helix-turn-helix domain-containing protein [Clostridium culturomicium]|uniref:helix-turn-helix domain-containing protein n=1 Tax=Clostridium culturomicium TaxID=1499683 RepID=UPI0005911EF0|nr:helix-turn-helix domain-containing protein [Clostridium culturomicium]